VGLQVTFYVSELTAMLSQQTKEFSYTSIDQVVEARSPTMPPSMQSPVLMLVSAALHHLV
jgi:hypothetical protein